MITASEANSKTQEVVNRAIEESVAFAEEAINKAIPSAMFTTTIPVGALKTSVRDELFKRLRENGYTVDLAVGDRRDPGYATISWLTPAEPSE